MACFLFGYLASFGSYTSLSESDYFLCIFCGYLLRMEQRKHFWRAKKNSSERLLKTIQPEKDSNLKRLVCFEYRERKVFSLCCMLLLLCCKISAVNGLIEYGFDTFVFFLFLLCFALLDMRSINPLVARHFYIVEVQ